MSDLLYFAYGSNMMTARLRQRCPTAKAVGLGIAHGCCLNFSKIGLGGSGKATLRRSPAQQVYGVLFELSAADLPALDAAEARYDRIGDFPVHIPSAEDSIAVTTYVAQPEACDPALTPFDWYHALIVAGAREHALPHGYIAYLQQVTTRMDIEKSRPGRITALDCLAFAANA